jgi:hypothetical protein
VPSKPVVLLAAVYLGSVGSMGVVALVCSR